MVLIQLFAAILSVWWGIQLLGFSGKLIPVPSLHGGEGSSLPDCVSPNDTADSKSVVPISETHCFWCGDWVSG